MVWGSSIGWLVFYSALALCLPASGQLPYNAAFGNQLARHRRQAMSGDGILVPLS